MFQSSISVVRDIFQVLFFITVGTVTVLTYLKAKRTLLQPIRTEVFKEQLKVFADILTFFQGKGEVDLRDELDFDNLLSVNYIDLLDDYASIYFKLEIDRKQRPYNSSECSSSIVPITYVQKFFTPVDGYLNETSQEEGNKPEGKHVEWDDYEYGVIHIPNKTRDRLKELDKIMDSPLIPKALLALLDKYKETVRNNMLLISTLLTECSQELPNQYPAIETLEKAGIGWVRFKYNREFVCLEGNAKEITDYVRNYFDTDNLFN